MRGGGVRVMDVAFFQALQAGGQLALVAIAAYLVKLDRRVLRLEIKTGNDQGKQ